MSRVFKRLRIVRKKEGIKEKGKKRPK